MYFNIFTTIWLFTEKAKKPVTKNNDTDEEDEKDGIDKSGTDISIKVCIFHIYIYNNFF